MYHESTRRNYIIELCMYMYKNQIQCPLIYRTYQSMLYFKKSKNGLIFCKLHADNVIKLSYIVHYFPS